MVDHVGLKDLKLIQLVGKTWNELVWLPKTVLGGNTPSDFSWLPSTMLVGETWDEFSSFAYYRKRLVRPGMNSIGWLAQNRTLSRQVEESYWHLLLGLDGSEEDWVRCV